jgi:hypothetical protein
MGKDGGGDNKKWDKAAANIAQDIYAGTSPNRKRLLSNQENFLEGDYDISQNPVWGAGRGVIEDQYSVAEENVIGATPRGGALTDQITNLESNRADALGGLAAQVSQDEYNKTYGAAFGAPQQSMSTLTALSGQNAMANAQESAGKMGAMGDLGLGAGMYFGNK